MYNLKKGFSAVISILLILAMTLPVFAGSGFDGDAGGGSSGSTSSDWSVPSTADERTAIVGYRFTFVTELGALIGHSVDVYIGSGAYPAGYCEPQKAVGNGSVTISGASHSIKKYRGYTSNSENKFKENNKLYYVDHDNYEKVDFSQSDRFISTATNTTYTFMDSTLGVGLTYKPSNDGSRLSVNNAVLNATFRNNVYWKCVESTIEQPNDTDMIIVEPLTIACLGKINGSRNYYVFTTSEWAIYMANVWTGSFTTTMSNSHTKNASSFYNIDNLVCAGQPAFLYVTGLSENYVSYNAETKTYFGKIKVPGSFIQSSNSNTHGQYNGTVFIGPNAAHHKSDGSQCGCNTPKDLLEYGVGVGIYWGTGTPPPPTPVTKNIYVIPVYDYGWGDLRNDLPDGGSYTALTGYQDLYYGLYRDADGITPTVSGNFDGTSAPFTLGAIAGSNALSLTWNSVNKRFEGTYDPGSSGVNVTIAAPEVYDSNGARIGTSNATMYSRTSTGNIILYLHYNTFSISRAENNQTSVFNDSKSWAKLVFNGRNLSNVSSTFSAQSNTVYAVRGTKIQPYALKTTSEINGTYDSYVALGNYLIMNTVDSVKRDYKVSYYTLEVTSGTNITESKIYYDIDSAWPTNGYKTNGYFTISANSTKKVSFLSKYQTRTTSSDTYGGDVTAVRTRTAIYADFNSPNVWDKWTSGRTSTASSTALFNGAGPLIKDTLSGGSGTFVMDQEYSFKSHAKTPSNTITISIPSGSYTVKHLQQASYGSSTYNEVVDDRVTGTVAASNYATLSQSSITLPTGSQVKRSGNNLIFKNSATNVETTVTLSLKSGTTFINWKMNGSNIGTSYTSITGNITLSASREVSTTAKSYTGYTKVSGPTNNKITVTSGSSVTGTYKYDLNGYTVTIKVNPSNGNWGKTKKGTSGTLQTTITVSGVPYGTVIKTNKNDNTDLIIKDVTDIYAQATTNTSTDQYWFDSWTIGSTTGNVITDTNSLTVTENVTIYANFKNKHTDPAPEKYYIYIVPHVNETRPSSVPSGWTGIKRTNPDGTQPTIGWYRTGINITGDNTPGGTKPWSTWNAEALTDAQQTGFGDTILSSEWVVKDTSTGAGYLKITFEEDQYIRMVDVFGLFKGDNSAVHLINFDGNTAGIGNTNVRIDIYYYTLTVKTYLNDASHALPVGPFTGDYNDSLFKLNNVANDIASTTGTWSSNVIYGKYSISAKEYNTDTTYGASAAAFGITNKEAFAVTAETTITIDYFSALYNVNNSTYGQLNNSTSNVVAKGASVSFEGNKIDNNYPTIKIGGKRPTASKKSVDGYTITFNGWTPQISTITARTTFTANFSATANSYTATFVPNNGTWSSGSGNKTKSYTIESVLSAPTTISRTGYTFAGWKVTAASSDGNWVVGTVYNKSTQTVLTGSSGMYGDVTFTAQWTATSYTATFVPNNGTWSSGSGNKTQSYTIESILTVPATISRTGYTFAGWKVTAASSGSNWVVDTVYNNNPQTILEGTSGKYGNVTFTAQWTINQYNVYVVPYLDKQFVSKSTFSNASEFTNKYGYNNTYFIGYYGPGPDSIPDAAENTFDSKPFNISGFTWDNSSKCFVATYTYGSTITIGVPNAHADSLSDTTFDSTGNQSVSMTVNGNKILYLYYYSFNFQRTENGNTNSFIDGNSKPWLSIGFNDSTSISVTSQNKGGFAIRSTTIRPYVMRTPSETNSNDYTYIDVLGSNKVVSGPDISYDYKFNYYTLTVSLRDNTNAGRIYYDISGSWDNNISDRLKALNLTTSIPSGNDDIGYFQVNKNSATKRTVSFFGTYQHRSVANPTYGTAVMSKYVKTAIAAATTQDDYKWDRWTDDYDDGTVFSSQEISLDYNEGTLVLGNGSVRYRVISENAYSAHAAKGYTITYDPNPPSVTNYFNVVTRVDGDPVSASDWPDYGFSGSWAFITAEFSSGTKSEYIGSIDRRMSKAITLEYSGSTASQTNVFLGTTVPVRNNGYTVDGYEFTGWNTARDGSGYPYAEESGIEILSDVTLYAQWNQTTYSAPDIGYTAYAKRYDNDELDVMDAYEVGTIANGGTLYLDYYTVTAEKGDSISNAVIYPEKTDMNGDSLFDDEYESTIILKGTNIKVLADIGTTEPGYAIYNYNILWDTISGEINVANTMSGDMSTSSYEIDRTTTIRAKASVVPQPYIITYEGNGATSGIPDNDYYYITTTSYEVKGAPVRDGFNFIGWKVTTGGYSAAGNTKYFAQDSMYSAGYTKILDKAYGSVTLTAQWSQDPTVTFRLDNADYVANRVVTLRPSGISNIILATQTGTSSVYTFAGTTISMNCDVYVNGENTGVTIPVTGNKNVVIDYYSLSLDMDAGISTVSQKFTAAITQGSTISEIGIRVTKMATGTIIIAGEGNTMPNANLYLYNNAVQLGTIATQNYSGSYGTPSAVMIANSIGLNTYSVKLYNQVGSTTTDLGINVIVGSTNGHDLYMAYRYNTSVSFSTTLNTSYTWKEWKGTWANGYSTSGSGALKYTSAENTGISMDRQRNLTATTYSSITTQVDTGISSTSQKYRVSANGVSANSYIDLVITNNGTNVVATPIVRDNETAQWTLMYGGAMPVHNLVSTSIGMVNGTVGMVATPNPFTMSYNTNYDYGISYINSDTGFNLKLFATPTALTVYYPTGTSVDIDAVVQTGYEWNNWSGTESYSNKNQMGVEANGTITEKANANITHYTITYRWDSQSTKYANEIIDSDTYTILDEVTLPALPSGDEWTYYTVTGWYDLDSLLYKLPGTKVIEVGSTGDREFTATNYRTAYTAQFIPNGGSWVTSGLSGTRSVTYYGESVLSAPSVIRRYGYTFTGWKITTTAGNWPAVDAVDSIYNNDPQTRLTGTAGMYGNVTFTAQWEREAIDSITVNKEWEDFVTIGPDTRPSSITVRLVASYYDGDESHTWEAATATLNSDNNWSYTFTSDSSHPLYKYSDDNYSITYSVTEDAVPGYTTSIEENNNIFTITNTLICGNPTVYIKLDSDEYSLSGIDNYSQNRRIVLKNQSNSYTYSISGNSSEYDFTGVVPGTYDIYIGDYKDTGIDLVVTTAGGTAVVNYYSLNTIKGSGVNKLSQSFEAAYYNLHIGLNVSNNGNKIVVSPTIYENATSSSGTDGWTLRDGNNTYTLVTGNFITGYTCSNFEYNVDSKMRAYDVYYGEVDTGIDLVLYASETELKINYISGSSATFSVTTPTDIQTGYTWSGWIGSVNSILPTTSILMDDQKSEIAAADKIQYTITYMWSSNSVVDANKTITTKTYTVTDAVGTISNPHPSVPDLDGYTESGWYIDPACTLSVTSIGPGATGNITLYAKNEYTPGTISIVPGNRESSRTLTYIPNVSVSGTTFVYNGEEQNPVWTYNGATISGDQNRINVGNYTTVFTATAPYNDSYHSIVDDTVEYSSIDDVVIENTLGADLSISISGNTDAADINLIGNTITIVPDHDGAITVTVTATKEGYSIPSVSFNITITTNYNAGSTERNWVIEKSPIVVTAGSSSKTYDGNLLTNYNFTEEGLLEGHSIECTFSNDSTITDVGSVYNEITEIIIRDDQLNDVTSNYDITTVDGVLRVNARSITITGNSASYEYDGTQKTVSGATVTSGSLVSGHTITSTSSASGIAVGRYDHTPSSLNTTIKNGSVDVTSNYNITYVKGTLTISENPQTLTISVYKDNTLYTEPVNISLNNSVISVTGSYTTSLSYGDSYSILAPDTPKGSVYTNTIDAGTITSDKTIRIDYYSVVTHGDFGIDTTSQTLNSVEGTGHNEYSSVVLKGKTIEVNAGLISDKSLYVNIPVVVELDGSPWEGQDVDLYQGTEIVSHTTYNATEKAYITDIALTGDGTVYKIYVNGEDTGKTITLTAKRTFNWKQWNKCSGSSLVSAANVQSNSVVVNAKTCLCARTTYVDTVTISGAVSYTETAPVPEPDTPDPGEVEYGKITVNKMWDGGVGSSVTVKLYADNTEVGTAILSADNSWKYTFNDMPWYKANGEKINYTVDETAVPTGYTKLISDGSHTIWNVKKDVPTPNDPSVEFFTVTAIAGENVSTATVNGSSSIIVLKNTTVNFRADREDAAGYTYVDTITWTYNVGGTGTFTSVTGNNVSKVIGETTTVTAATTRTANGYAIHYRWADDPDTDITGISISYLTYTYGTEKTLAPVPTSSDYASFGWYATPECTGSTVSKIEDTDMGDKVFYAKRTVTVTINVNPDGYGIVSQSTISNIPYGSTPSTSSNTLTVNETTVTATPATDSTGQYDYLFESWSNVPSSLTANITITANFSRIERDQNSVSFSLNSPLWIVITKVNNVQTSPSGYSGAWAKANLSGINTDISQDETRVSVSIPSISSIPCYIGSSITLPTPSCSGWIFDGWYDDADGGNKIGNGGASYTPAASVTLYAHWSLDNDSPNIPTITAKSDPSSEFGAYTPERVGNVLYIDYYTVTTKGGSTTTNGSVTKSGDNVVTYLKGTVVSIDATYSSTITSTSGYARVIMNKDGELWTDIKVALFSGNTKAYDLVYNNGIYKYGTSMGSMFMETAVLESRSPYNIRYSTNNGSTWIETGRELVIPDVRPYVFSGWSVSGTGLTNASSVNTTTNQLNTASIYTLLCMGQMTYTTETLDVITYTITYKWGSGSAIHGGDTISTDTYTVLDTKPLPGTPSVEAGYTASAWFTNDACTSAASNITVGTTGNKTFYAKNTINSYTLTIYYKYTDNTTAASTHTETVQYNATYSVTSPTVTGYTPDQAVVSGTMPADNVTVTVVYSAGDNSYVVKHWKQNAGKPATPQNSTNYTEVTADRQTIASITGASVTPATKSYAGYTSPSTQTVTVAADGSTVVNYYYTLITYTITYKWGSGSAIHGGETISTDTYTVLDAKPLPGTPSVEAGYTASAWFTNNACTSAASNITAGTTGNKTFYAKNTINTYTVTYNANNPAAYNLTVVTRQDGTQSVPTGYTNWAKVIFNGTTYTVNEASKTLTQTAPTNSNQSVTINYGGTLGTLPTLSATGYTFDGWYTDVTGGTKVTSSTTVTGNVTYYAHWTKNQSYSVTAKQTSNASTYTAYTPVVSGTTLYIDYYTVSTAGGSYITSVSGAGVYLKGYNNPIGATIQTEPASSTSTSTVNVGTVTISFTKDGTAYSKKRTVTLVNGSTTIAANQNNSTNRSSYTFSNVPSNKTYTLYIDGLNTGYTAAVVKNTQTTVTTYSYSFDNWAASPTGKGTIRSASSKDTWFDGLSGTVTLTATGKRTTTGTTTTKDNDNQSFAVDYFTVTANSNNSYSYGKLTSTLYLQVPYNGGRIRTYVSSVSSSTKALRVYYYNSASGTTQITDATMELYKDGVKYQDLTYSSYYRPDSNLSAGTYTLYIDGIQTDAVIVISDSVSTVSLSNLVVKGKTATISTSLNSGAAWRFWKGTNEYSNKTQSITVNETTTETVYYNRFIVTATAYNGMYDGSAHNDVSSTTARYVVTNLDTGATSNVSVNISTCTLTYNTNATTYPSTDYTSDMPTIINAGTQPIRVKVVDASGNIAYSTVTATVTKRNVTLTSGTEEFDYDGNAHGNNTVTVSGDGFVTGEGATYSNFPTVTERNESKSNTFTYTLKSGTLAGNYTITQSYGTISIKSTYCTLTINHAGGFSQISVFANNSTTAIKSSPYKIQITVPYNTKLDVSGTVATGNTFKNWTGASTSTNAKVTITVTSDMTLTAHATTTLKVNHFLHNKSLDWEKVYTNTTSGLEIGYSYTYSGEQTQTLSGYSVKSWSSATYTITKSTSVSAKSYFGFNGWKTVYYSSSNAAPTVGAKNNTSATTVYIVSGGSYVSMYFTRAGSTDPTTPTPINPTNPTTPDPDDPQYPEDSPISGKNEYVTITYVMNGGKYNNSSNNYSQTVPAATNTTLITPTRAGYEFVGWYTNKNGTGRIGGGGDGYTVTNSITVYALWYSPYDIGITANDIYGTIIKGASFISSATIVNHTRSDLLYSHRVDAILTVYENGMVKGDPITILNIEAPALKTNLVSATVSTTGWEEGKIYTLVWTLNFDRATFSDKYSNNNRSSVGPINPGAAYNNAVNTARPAFSTTQDTRYNKNATVPATSVNTYRWQEWTSASGLVTYSTKMNITLILTPENENGLKTKSLSAYKIPNYVTRAGYGFSINRTSGDLNDMTLSRKFSNVSLVAANNGTTAYTRNIGNLTAQMTYPEFNYTKMGKSSWTTYSTYYTDSTGTATYTNLATSPSGSYWTLRLPSYSDYASSDPYDKYSHYTPMWMPQSNTAYVPVTYFGGLWSPIGEITATVRQGQLTTQAQMDSYGVYTNSYILRGSLYDDLYGTGN